MTKVVCLVGSSASGKTSVAKKLECEGYNVIQSYTTREERYSGEYGHIFIESWKVGKKPDGSISSLTEISEVFQSGFKTFYREDMIAYFNSYKSSNHYFATDDQVIRGKVNLYVVDPNGAKMVHDFYKDSDIEVITIFISASEEVRINRLKERCNLEDVEENVYSRIYNDREVFSKIKCNYTICGDGSIEDTAELIVKVLQ